MNLLEAMEIVRRLEEQGSGVEFCKVLQTIDVIMDADEIRKSDNLLTFFIKILILYGAGLQKGYNAHMYQPEAVARERNALLDQLINKTILDLQEGGIDGDFSGIGANDSRSEK